MASEVIGRTTEMESTLYVQAKSQGNKIKRYCRFQFVKGILRLHSAYSVQCTNVPSEILKLLDFLEKPGYMAWAREGAERRAIAHICREHQSSRKDPASMATCGCAHRNTFRTVYFEPYDIISVPERDPSKPSKRPGTGSPSTGQPVRTRPGTGRLRGPKRTGPNTSVPAVDPSKTGTGSSPRFNGEELVGIWMSLDDGERRRSHG
jgi:hypothetical protein